MICYMCGGILKELGSIPFDKNEGILPCIDTTPVQYVKCIQCNFVCAPEMLNWTPEQFKSKIYNEEYNKVDTGYGGERAGIVAGLVSQLHKHKVPHLDYGSGEGHLSNILTKKGWDSTYYDPFSSPTRPNRKFRLITAIEVFEHSTNVFDLIKDIKSFLDKNGVILFSTRLADENTDIDWWYICARAGHIGIQSAKSLKIAAIKNGLFFSSLDDAYHILQPTRNSLKELIRGDK